MALRPSRKLLSLLWVSFLTETEQSCWSSNTATPVLQSAKHMELKMNLANEACGSNLNKIENAIYFNFQAEFQILFKF